jgi:hypothetical protein
VVVFIHRWNGEEGREADMLAHHDRLAIAFEFLEQSRCGLRRRLKTSLIALLRFVFKE